MTETDAKPDRQDKLRQVLDWAVFSAGAVSLGVAMGATFLTHAGLTG